MNSDDTGDNSKSNEGRNYVMAPALPVHPDEARPIEKRVKIKGDQDDKNDENDDDTIELELDADERHLFRSIQEAAKAWEEGRLTDILKNASRTTTMTITTTSTTSTTTTADMKSPKKIQVRVAGGWVRDKILGLSTHDVDIALDTCTGVEFANVLKAYVESSMETGPSSSSTSFSDQQQSSSNSSSINNNKCGKIGVIAANPAQSKHLETATMRIFGVDVDFSNLRHETYAEDSRIPETGMGTPLEDAYRRDFTMNSLYYNLETQCIEDWTRRGLQDLLQSRVVHTPLEAYQTFHDDPLRVLRAIRFAIRYQMDLSPDLQAACMNSQIHQELHRKVSRERVGKELEGMLSGKHANPLQAIDLICSMKLAGSVFCIPPSNVTLIGTIGQARLEQVPYHASDEQGLARLREIAWQEARECIRVLPTVLEALGSCCQTGSTAAKTAVDGRLVYLATLMLPYEHLQYIEKQKQKNVSEFMMREGIKFKNKDALSIVALVTGLDDMVQLLQQPPEATPITRLQIGMLLRSTKEMWVTTLVVATVALLRRQINGEEAAEIDWCTRATYWYTSILHDMKLDECWKIKPLLNGKELMQFLGLPKGPEVGVYSLEQVKWMLMNHPNGSIEDLQHFLKAFQQTREQEENQAAQHIPKKMHL